MFQPGVGDCADVGGRFREAGSGHSNLWRQSTSLDPEEVWTWG